ncbi:MAG TPA: hypothetical protein VGC42_25730, partial [Kofleriaceae bacterium]
DDPARREAIAGHLQAVVAATGALADLVAWADELRRQNVVDGARATLELAIACGHAADVHQQAFLSVHPAHAMRDDEAYKALVDGDRALITDPGEAELAPLAIALAETAALVWPDLDDILARNAAAGARRIPASRHTPVTSMFPRVATALGAGAVVLYEHDGPDAITICAATPVIVLGARMLSAETRTDEVRAILVRAVELTRPEHAAVTGLPAGDAVRLLTSVIRLFGPAALRDAVNALVDDADVQRGHDDMVRAALPVKLRTRFEQLLAPLSVATLDLARYRTAAEHGADRAALLLGGDARAIVALAAARGDSPAHLIAALAQPGWLALRARLGLAAR